MEAVRDRDEPWSRLAWHVPLAALLTLVGLMSFLRLLEGPEAVTPEPRPLEVQVVMPPPAIGPAPLAPRGSARPVPSPPVSERRPVERRLEPPPPASARQIEPGPESVSSPRPEVANPVVESRDAPPPLPAASPQPVVPSGPLGKEPGPRPAGAPGASQAPAAAASNPVPGVRGGSLSGGSAGARAIYQPLPEIPEALRHRSVEITTVARFRVAANGSAQVELTEPTADPDLNRAVLEALRRWRFFPAMQDGKPVTSTLDIRIPISVK